MKQPSRNTFFFFKKHNNDKSWSSNIHGSFKNCLKYTAIWTINGGLLFTAKDFFSYLINVKAQNSDKHFNNAEHTCEVMLFGHWTDCNAYPMTVAGISKKVTALFNKYRDIEKYQCQKKSLKYWEKYDSFKDKQNKLFDIHGESNYVRAQEKLWEAEMNAADKAFYNN